MHLALAPPVLATALLVGILIIALLAAPWQLALGVTAGLAAVLGWHPSPDQPSLLMLAMAATIVLLVLPQFVPGRPPWRRTRSRPLFNQIWIRMLTWADLHTCEGPPVPLNTTSTMLSKFISGMTNGATLNITPAWSRYRWAADGAVPMRN